MRFEDVRKGDRVRFEYRSPTGRLILVEDECFYLGRTRECWVSKDMKTVCSDMAGAKITLLARAVGDEVADGLHEEAMCAVRRCD
jgi:hypothetical protein